MNELHDLARKRKMICKVDYLQLEIQKKICIHPIKLNIAKQVYHYKEGK